MLCFKFKTAQNSKNLMVIQVLNYIDSTDTGFVHDTIDILRF